MYELMYHSINPLKRSIMETKKSENKSLENKRVLFTECGLVVALLFVYLGFNLSSKETRVAVLEDTTQVVCDDYIAIQTFLPPPPPEAPSLPNLSDVASARGSCSSCALRPD